MEKISVVVSGTGFMGREVLAAVSREEDMQPVGVIEKFSREEFVSLPTGGGLVPLSSDAQALLERLRPRVVIDFTNAEWTPVVAKAALGCGASLVIGTTGHSEAFLNELAAECRAKGLGAVVAPNFAIGAVIMVHLAKDVGEDQVVAHRRRLEELRLGYLALAAVLEGKAVAARGGEAGVGRRPG